MGSSGDCQTARGTAHLKSKRICCSLTPRLLLLLATIGGASGAHAVWHTTTTVTTTAGVTTTVTTTAAVTTVTTTAGVTTTAAVATTTRDPCSAATHPCVCASALATCAWASYANGGGKCFFDANAKIDCGLCPSQAKCAGSACSAFTDACRCAQSTSSCAWNTALRACVTRGAYHTPCSVCAAQPICQLSKPTTTAFDPPNGNRGSGVNNVLQVVFSVEMKWCVPAADRSVSLWCEGSQTQSINFAYLGIVASSLKVDVSYAVRGLSRDEDRKCGITIPADILCDRLTSSPFGGLSKASYSFTLSDTSAPKLVGFEPNDGASGVDPSTVVQFTFDEPIVLGPSTLFMIFSTLDTDRSGAASSEVSSKAYPLQIPYVSAQGDRILQFDMKGKTSPGWLYSISLPSGAVVDRSGNKFVGLSGGKYTFRTSKAVHIRTGSSNDMTGFLVGLIVGLVFFGVCIAALVWKLQLACYGQWAYKPEKERTYSGGPVQVPAKPQQRHIDQVQPLDYNGPSAGPPPPPGTVPSSFYGEPSANAGGPAGASPAATATGNDRTSWARSGSPAPKPEPERPERVYPKPERVYPEEARRNSNQGWQPPPARTSSKGVKPEPKAYAGPYARPHDEKNARPHEPASKTETAPVADVRNPEARAVEKKMRAAMNEPATVRKKMLKDLMLEHHPDKNAGSESAKEVFQFINGARGWFLHDA